MTKIGDEDKAARVAFVQKLIDAETMEEFKERTGKLITEADALVKEMWK